MCDMYGPLRPSHQQLSREMVGPSLLCFLWYGIHQAHSYSNYGGVSVKAEYSHEVVSRCIERYFQVMMRILGSTAGASHHLNLGCTLWAVYPTTSVSFNRLLRSVVCESTDGAYRGQESCQVRRQVLQRLLLPHLCLQPNICLLRMLRLSIVS